MNRLRSKLTYANVVSTLALFLVLAGGSALAASHLAKNSVGTKQIKNDAITAAKIENGAVTGSKIRVSTLGTVPSAGSASHASSADTSAQASNADSLGGAPASAYARTELEAVHVVGAAGQPAFEHGCGLGGGFGPVGFYKDPFGVVHLQGFLAGCTEGQSAFTLPVGFRPPTTESVIVVDGTSNTTSGLVSVDPNGSVVPFGSKVGSLTSVSFRTN
ncbi:MAG TPA: hypothetical protein VGI17_13935 [Solirubrobacterales bacterium]|jgi:hypothetical protein